MLGVVYAVFPESKRVPPVGAEYQSMVSPAPGVALSVTVPVPQRAFAVPAGEAGKAFTVVTMLLEVAGDPVAHEAVEVIMTDTSSPLANAVVV